MLSHSIERILPSQHCSREKYLLYLRHVFAYEFVIALEDAGARVLEIGSGEGYGARLLARHFDEVVAVDVDHKTIRHAQTRHGESNCEFRHYDGTQLPFAGGSFDLVVSMQVIEHVAEDVFFLEEARRVLKPECSFWLTTPNRLHRVPEGAEIWNPFHVREYRPHELERVLRQVFDDVRVGGIRGRTAEIDQIERRRVQRGMSLRKIIPEFVKGWIDRPALSRHSTSDFEVEWKDSGRSGLDLIGHCKKRVSS